MTLAQLREHLAKVQATPLRYFKHYMPYDRIELISDNGVTFYIVCTRCHEDGTTSDIGYIKIEVADE